MKKLYSWLFFVPAVLGLMCAVAACSEDEPDKPNTGDDEPTTPTTEEVTFQVNLADATATTASVNIVPSNEDATYFATVTESAEIASLDNAQLVSKYVAAEDFATMLHSGNFTLEATLLKPETMYTVVVFAFDNGKAGEVNKLEFKTGKQAETAEKFQITDLKVGYTDISCRVTPNSLTLPWYYVIMEKEYYQKYLDQEGENGPITRAYYVLSNKGADNGLDIGEYLQQVCMMGTHDLAINDLKQDKEYVLMVFYVNPYENDPTVIFDYYYAKAEFKTKTADPTQASTVEILGYDVTRADGMVTITVNAKATNAAAGKFRMTFSSYFKDYDINDPKIAYTVATMMGKALSEEQLKALQSVNGYDFTWEMKESDIPEPLLFGLYVQNAQGAGEAKAIEIDINK